MFKTSQEIKDVAAALVKAQGDLKNAVADSKNTFFNNAPYASLESYINVARPVLLKHKLAIVQGMIGEMKLQTTILHESGQWISYEMPIALNKQDMQSLGSAVSYARRYSLAAMLSMGSDDDDGNKTVSVAPQKTAPPTKPVQNFAPKTQPTGPASSRSQFKDPRNEPPMPNEDDRIPF